jgi:hypothetical protein
MSEIDPKIQQNTSQDSNQDLAIFVQTLLEQMVKSNMII